MPHQNVIKARSQTANRRVTRYGTTDGWATVQYPYKPDFVPSDFSLFGHLTNNLAGKQSARVEMVNITVKHNYIRIDLLI
jgi:hypothetical protein